MAGPYYTNTKVDNVDFIEAADLEAIETGFSDVDSDKANKKTPATANNLAALDSGGDLADSGKAYPAGAVVGTSDTQTLTNKTLDVDSNTLSNVEVDNFKATAIVTEAEGLNSSDNDTSLPTTAAVKDYVDNQVGANNELSEILANGNTSGANDLQINSGQALKTNTIDETTAGSGVTIDSVLLKDDVVNATDIETGSISANDGTASATIADSTGVMTIASSVLTSTDINGGTIDGVTIGGSSAGAITGTNLTATTSATLQHSSSTKLATTSTGIDVTGDVGGDTLTISGNGSIDGLTVGQGAGNVATNTAVGKDALDANTTGGSNTAIGQDALGANTTASQNTAVGYQAGYSTTSSYNTFNGYRSGYGVTTGNVNTGYGRLSLGGNSAGVTGSDNTALGNAAMYVTTSGTSNTAVGTQALFDNTTGSYNVAVGVYALDSNTTASNNTAVGYQAGYSNTTGVGSTALGYQALYSKITGNYSTAIGFQAGYSHTAGYSLYVGDSAGYYSTSYGNTFVGTSYAGGCGKNMTTGANNTIIGGYTGNQGGLDIRTSDNNIVLSDGDGNPVQRIRNGSNYVINEWRHSAGSMAGSLSFGSSYNEAGPTDALLKGYMGGDFHVVAGSAGVYLTNGATSWTSNSDERVKDIIENIDNAVTKVNGLRAVIGKYKTDNEDTRRVFLIAQDVQAVLPEAVNQKKDDIGTLGVAYTDVIPLLVAAIKEQTQTITTLEARIAALESN